MENLEIYKSFKRGYIVNGIFPHVDIQFGLCDPEGSLLDYMIMNWEHVYVPYVVNDMVPILKVQIQSWHILELFQDVFKRLADAHAKFRSLPSHAEVGDFAFIYPERFKDILKECGFVDITEKK